MRLFTDGELDIGCFAPGLVADLADFGAVLTSAAGSGSSLIESTHFLMALAEIEGSVTRRLFESIDVRAHHLVSGLRAAAIESDDLPPDQLTRESFHESALNAFDDLAEMAEEWELPRVSEPALLIAMLQHLTPEAEKLLRSSRIPVDELIERVRLESGPVQERPEPWVPEDADPDQQRLNLDAFSPSGRQVVEVMAREAQAFGHEQADARHLLLSLLVGPANVLPVVFHQQEVNVDRVREGLMLSMGRREAGVEREASLDHDRIQSAVRQMIQTAADRAARERSAKISEKHIAQAFFETQTVTRQRLTAYNLDIAQALLAVEQFEIDEDEVEEPQTPETDVQSVREYLQERIVGQPEAIEQCMRYVRRIMLGYRPPRGPAGVFLFCGESGTGKTEMAKALASAIYGSDEALLFLEMGQFQTQHSMSMLVGAPHGYVGFGEGKLTNALREDPARIILFDEFEKAHTEVYNTVLRFLDEGIIADPAGPMRDGRESTIVITTNVGSGELSALWDEVPAGEEGYWTIRKRVRQKLLDIEFRPELLNRVDECILFRDLDSQNLTVIARREVDSCINWLDENIGVHATVDEDAAGIIGEFCVVASEGARLAQSVARSVVLDSVIHATVEGDSDLGDHVRVSVQTGEGLPRGVVTAAESNGEEAAP